jgi:regulator of protease activity HflC (stomatin/prohibitin superfamily)
MTGVLLALEVSTTALIIVLGVLGLVAIAYVSSARVIRQYERGVVFRLGRVQEPARPPGLTLIAPIVDHLREVSLQIVTMPVPAQEGITRDNVTVRVDAVVYFRVHDPVRAIVEVQDYEFAVSQVAQTSLRSIIGKSELDDLLSNRELLNQGLALMIDSPAVGWGVEIDRVEIKDVELPDSMKRSMSRQAEAERERRSRIITADGEFQASQKLASAAAVMADTPAALQLRLAGWGQPLVLQRVPSAHRRERPARPAIVAGLLAPAQIPATPRVATHVPGTGARATGSCRSGW